MRIHKIFFAFTLIFVFSNMAFAQTSPGKSQSFSNSIKGSAAYAEILLHKVELESEMESLLITYTEDFPKVKEAKFELSLVQKDLTKLLTQTDATKLTLALGKLMVRKIQIETDLWALQNRLGDENPETKRAKRKLVVYQNAIREILP